MTKKLAHVENDFLCDIEDRTQEAILKDINDAGFSIGHQSLTMLLAGTCFQAGNFEVIDVRFAAGTKQPEGIAPVIAASVAAPVVVVEELKPVAATTTLHLPAAKPTVVAVAPEAPKPAPEPRKAKSRVVSDADIPTAPVEVLRGSKNGLMFEMLARPQGATRNEIMKAFDWSASCLASIIYTVPKSKGYTIVAEKIEDTLHYHLCFIGGAGKVLPEQILYRERKGTMKKEVVAAPATPAVVTPRVKVSRETLATVPVVGPNVRLVHGIYQAV